MRPNREMMLDFNKLCSRSPPGREGRGQHQAPCQTGPEIPFEYHLRRCVNSRRPFFSEDAKEGIAAYVEKRILSPASEMEPGLDLPQRQGVACTG